MLKKGDIVNIKCIGEGFWKGKVTEISTEYNDTIKYRSPIATVKGIDNPGHATVREENLKIEDGEWWERED